MFFTARPEICVRAIFCVYLIFLLIFPPSYCPGDVIIARTDVLYHGIQRWSPEEVVKHELPVTPGRVAWVYFTHAPSGKALESEKENIHRSSQKFDYM
jgi:hypothetical protein